MKDKIIARFRALFPTVNLTKKRLEEISAKLETKITDETEIDAKLTDLNELFAFAEIAKQDDRIVQLEKGKKPTEEQKPEEGKTEAKTDDEIPAWAKALLEKSEALEKQVSSFSKEKTVLDRRTELANTLKDADEVYRNKALKDFQRMNFETEEEFREYVSEAAEDLKVFNQKFSDAGLGGDKPKTAFGSAKVAETEVSPAVKNYLDSQKAEDKK